MSITINANESLSTNETHSKPLIVLAKLISYLLHPLFIPFFITLFMMYWFPHWFAGMNERRKIFFAVSIFFSTAFLPGFTVLLLKGLGFIDSIHLRTNKERIIPYIATMFFYWWSYNVSRNVADIPSLLKVLFFGIFICTSLAVVCNNFFKISMHAMGVGGLVAFMILLAMQSTQGMGMPLSIAILLAGLTCTARFIAGEHTQKEMYIGFFAGAFCQVVAWWIVG
jgi:hypothetical protein